MFLSSSKAKRAINWENTCSRTSKMNSTMVSAASSPSYSMTSSSVKMKMLSDSLRPGGRERRSPDPSKGHTQVGLIFWHWCSAGGGRGRLLVCTGMEVVHHIYSVSSQTGSFKFFAIIVSLNHRLSYWCLQLCCRVVYLISWRRLCRASRQGGRLRCLHRRTHPGPGLRAVNQRQREIEDMPCQFSLSP